MLYTAVQDTLMKTLLKHNGAMYIGANTWQSPNGFDILGVVISCLVELAGGKFKLEAMPLDFSQLAKSHTSEYLADMIQVVVEKFQIQNNTMLQQLSNGFRNEKIQSGEDGESSSDDSEGEDAEEQISLFDKDTTHPTHSSDDNDPVQPDNLEPKLTLDNIHNLSDKDEIMIFTPL
ncbi:hypothetical protein PSTG_14290, partial [Puccinia striiformis f. sp. tritici PST-78]